MQTFLPYPDFEDSAHALDQLRLGKQRVENLQIMQALLGYRIVTSERFFTGEFKTAYFDEDDNVVGPEITETGRDWFAETNPVFKTRIFEPEDWTFEPMTGRSWKHHPAVKMWKGHEFVLLQYQKAICDEWVHQCGFQDSCWEKTLRLYFQFYDGATDDELPWWIGDVAFHDSHQSNLIRKNPEYYKKQFPDIPDDLPYVWPTDKDES